MLNISANITKIAMMYSRVYDRDHDDTISMMLADDNMTAASTTNADSNTRRFVPSRSTQRTKWHFCAIIPRVREQRLTAALLWDCYVGSSVAAHSDNTGAPIGQPFWLCKGNHLQMEENGTLVNWRLYECFCLLIILASFWLFSVIISRRASNTCQLL